MKKALLLFSATVIIGWVHEPVLAKGPKDCPPGLDKKGCVPPGQAKKRYQVGQSLPRDVAYAPVDWRDRYAPPPTGAVYGRVDSDILLIAEGTRRVIELIGIADALSN